MVIAQHTQTQCKRHHQQGKQQKNDQAPGENVRRHQRLLPFLKHSNLQAGVLPGSCAGTWCRSCRQ
ncbi:MAG: hypothetical protein EXR85_00635 [Xanthomonadales bacterium]|nr:hypothetical protein [Xanthomonadales bacterium]